MYPSLENSTTGNAIMKGIKNVTNHYPELFHMYFEEMTKRILKSSRKPINLLFEILEIV